MTARFSGANGFVKKLHCEHVDANLKAVPGSEFEIDAELVLLAMGFVHPTHEGMINDLNLALDRRGNVSASTEDYRTSVDKVFTAGDMRRGQSLVVWAIREGRQAAYAVDEFRWARACCHGNSRTSSILGYERAEPRGDATPGPVVVLPPIYGIMTGRYREGYMAKTAKWIVAAFGAVAFASLSLAQD